MPTLDFSLLITNLFHRLIHRLSGGKVDVGEEKRIKQGFVRVNKVYKRKCNGVGGIFDLQRENDGI